MTRVWISVTALSFVLILLSVWLEESARDSSGHVAHPSPWPLAPFSLYLVATHVLAPWDVMRRRLARVPGDIASGEMVVYPWWSWLFLGPYLLGDRRAKVPSIASAVLVWLLCVLCAWLFLVLSAVTVASIHGALHAKA